MNVATLAQRASNNARRIGVGVIIACVALLSAGCAAGQNAATAVETPAMDALAAASVGSMQLRDIAIKAPATGVFYAKGSDATLIVVMVNTARVADALTAVTTSAASGWVAFANQADATAAGSGGLTSSTGPVQTASASASGATGTGTGSSPPVGASPSGVTSSTSAPAPIPAIPLPIPIPAAGSLSFGVPSSPKVLVLTGLTGELHTAQSVKITFSFANAGSVTIFVPVQLSSSAPESVIPSPTG